MKKISKDHAGFGVLEALIVILVLIIATGLIVYRDSHKTKLVTKTTSTNSKQSSTNPYAGWSSYNDAYISFKYPSGWQAGRGSDKYTTYDTGITSTGFTSKAISTVSNPGAPVTLSLQLDTEDSPMSCGGYNSTCQIAMVIPLNNSSLANSSFAIVNETSPGGTAYTQYAVVKSDTQVGDTTINPTKFGNSGIYIYGQPYYTPESGGLTAAARITNANAFQSSPTFKSLLKLLDSVKLTTNTSSAVLGEPWAPNQGGYGTVKPSTINNGGAPTGIVSDITWQS